MSRTIMGIDPGLANTGWGIIEGSGVSLRCVAYGCVSTPCSETLSNRLLKIYEQLCAVIDRFDPSIVGIESILFGRNASAAFKTGQARGAALVACASNDMDVREFPPDRIKISVTGVGNAEKHQVQYMVQKLLHLDKIPEPDHAADALAAAICCTNFYGMDSGGETDETSFSRKVRQAIEAQDRLRGRA